MLAIMRPMDRTPFPPARSPRSPALALALGGGAARCLRWPSARQRRSRACKWQRKAPRRRSRPRTPGWRSTALTWPGFRRRSRPRGRRRSSGGRARLAPASGGEAGPAGSGADLAAPVFRPVRPGPQISGAPKYNKCTTYIYIVDFILAIF